MIVGMGVGSGVWVVVGAGVAVGLLVGAGAVQDTTNRARSTSKATARDKRSLLAASDFGYSPQVGLVQRKPRGGMGRYP